MVLVTIEGCGASCTSFGSLGNVKRRRRRVSKGVKYHSGLMAVLRMLQGV